MNIFTREQEIKRFFLGGNSQQQTEIVFTEDDSSCDSQKWGKISIPRAKNYRKLRIKNTHNWRAFDLTRKKFCFVSNVFFRIFFTLTRNLLCFDSKFWNVLSACLLFIVIISFYYDFFFVCFLQITKPHEVLRFFFIIV